MTLYTAILVACLALEPQPVGCRTHEMLVMAGANPISAFVEAQAKAAEWLADRPDLHQLSLTLRTGRSA